MPTTIKPSVWTLVTLCAVLGLDGMDVASMSPTLPAIRDELGMSAASLQWVVSAYVIGYGGFVLIGGRLADLFPPRRLLLVAMLIFAAASFVGALADDGDVLIVTRLAKGIAAGFTAPAALAILLRTYTEEDERNRALGAFISTGAVGFTSGLALGGALTGASWRWTMVLPTCLALAIAAAAVRFVPALSRATTDRRRVDLIGALLVTTGLLALVYGVSNASSAGWANRETLLALAGSGLLLTAFVAVEHVRREPLVPLGIFGRPELAPANVAALLFQGSYVAFQFVATLYLQERLDWTPLQTGLAFVPGGLAVVLLSSRFAGLVSRVGAWPLAAGGLVLEAVGYLWFGLAIGDVDPVVLMLVAQTGIGLGYAAIYPSLNIAAVAHAREDEQGLAGGMFIASTQVGSGIVLAVCATVFAANADAALGAHHAGVWVIVVAIGLAALLALAMAARRAGSRRLEHPALTQPPATEDARK
jgi:MFS family permease